MIVRGSRGFRFDPPGLELTADLEWVLLRAFAPIGAARLPRALSAPVRLAQALGLAVRIAARQGLDLLAAEAGVGAAEELRALRAESAARDLQLEAALASLDRVAADRQVPYAILKGRALSLLGRTPMSGRPASDLDLLLPIQRVPGMQRALLEAGFRDPGNPAYEHQAPMLLHAAGGALELHRAIPGVRVDGRRSATFEALEVRGLLDRVPAGGRRLAGDARVPAREVLIAHVLVHTLAQHAFAAAHPGFQMVADLIDLECGETNGVNLRNEPWIEADVSHEEIEAAFGLAASLAAGDLRILDGPSHPAARLAAHFLACATDPTYGDAIRFRGLERPVSDRPRIIARLLLAARALAPPGRAGVRDWLQRPFDLLERRAKARARRADSPAGGNHGPADRFTGKPT